MRMLTRKGAPQDAARRFSEEKWNVNTMPYFSIRIRRSLPAAREKMAIKFLFGKKQALKLSLSGKYDEKEKVIQLPRAIDWKSNTWHDVVIDVRKIMTTAEPEWSKQKHPYIHSVHVVAETSAKGETIDLKDLFVFGPRGKDEKGHVSAFDASGIAGLKTVSEKVGSTNIDRAEGRALSWSSVHVNDRAGNTSHTIWVPVVADGPRSKEVLAYRTPPPLEPKTEDH